MAQFIFVTDLHDIKHRLNVDLIASYAAIANDGGCSARVMMDNEFALDVQEEVDEIDSLIQNTKGPTLFSARR